MKQETLLTKKQLLALEGITFKSTKLNNMIKKGVFPPKEESHGHWVQSKVEYAIIHGNWNPEEWAEWRRQNGYTLAKTA